MATMKIEPVLAEVCELLALLTIKFGSATLAQMPSHIDEAKDAARTILRGCLASGLASHLSPEEVATLRAELAKLGNAALEAQLAGIIDIRWLQLMGGGASSTPH
jgi:hypothetical protein